MKNLHIAIVGGGLGGLTAAASLALDGHRVTLFEATSAWGDVGAGITLAPNAMHALAHIGIAEQVAEKGAEPVTQTVSHWADSRVLVSIDRSQSRERYGVPYVYIHRADLHSLLAERAAECGADLHLGKRLLGTEDADNRLRLNFDDGSIQECDLLIGADGLKSVVRRDFGGSAPQFTGHIAYRALAPASPEIQALIDQPGVHIGPGKMVVRYPLRHGSLLNLVFFAREDGWTEDGWSIRAQRQELLSRYGDWCDDIGRLIAGLNGDTLFKWAINAHSPLPSWSRHGNTTVLGDAAHAMTPFLGQGAATALEDGIVLSRCLAGADSVEAALERYETARYERCKMIQHESNENADRLQGAETEMFGVGNLVNEETLGLFDYDCRAVSV